MTEKRVRIIDNVTITKEAADAIGGFTKETATWWVEIPSAPKPELPDAAGEKDEFEAIVAKYKECEGVSRGGCGCTGRCLGHHLAKLRKKYDAHYQGDSRWWSDQLHGMLLTRAGDSGRNGAALTAENYWAGAK